MPAEPGSRSSGPSAPWLVAGLGNPGPAYAATRHNIGQMVVEELADRMGTSWRRHRSGHADTAECRLGPPGPDPVPRLLLVRTRGYMNDSGPPLAVVAAAAGVPPARIVCAHDELDLPFGAVRVKQGGGDNGHNGLRSVRRALGTGDFARVRTGIGRPPGREDPADYVLARFSSSERRELPIVVGVAADMVESLVLRGLAHTQNHFHGQTDAIP